MIRRQFLSFAGAAALAHGARKRIAIVATVYRRNSHADVIAGRLLGGYEYNGERRQPQVDVATLYVHQFPANDMSRELSKQYGFRLCSTVKEAVKGVDGVVLIGEHGEYPFNEKGQHLYPRYELYRQVMEVFRATGRAVPLYCDKHFSYDWTKAKWMYDQSREKNFPLMAGSSVPVTWRRPELEIPAGTPLDRAVMVGYGEKEAYGFHALEGLQCMVERRRGFETGITAVECLEGDAVWQWTDRNAWAGELMSAAVRRCEGAKSGEPRAVVKAPVLFLLEYVSGLRAAVYLLNGLVQQFSFAATVSGQTVSTEMWLQPARFYNHFSGLVYWIEQMMVTGRAPYPVERTLLTTGSLAALMDSGFARRRLETPQLAIKYEPVRASQYSRGPVPPPLGDA